jgi:hypothetical protein
VARVGQLPGRHWNPLDEHLLPAQRQHLVATPARAVTRSPEVLEQSSVVQGCEPGAELRVPAPPAVEIVHSDTLSTRGGEG